MSSLLLYLLESSVILIFLYGLYLLLLRKETFFNFNRFFLIAILVMSTLFPLVSFEILSSENSLINERISELGKARGTYYTTVEDWTELNTVLPEERSWWQQFWFQEWKLVRVVMVCSVFIYSLGFSFLVVRLVLIHLKIYGLKKKLSINNLSGLKVARISSKVAPFSFLNTVFMPDNIKDKSEFDQILAHEKTHIQQRHSIDLIFVQLVAALMWFNPLIWLLIKSLKQTHEYIADKNMLRQGFSIVEYQSLLLRQLISNNSYGLVHNFNLSFIKKRITMMSIKESGWAGKSKALIALSVTLLMGMMTAQSNSRLDIPIMVESKELPSGDKSEIQFYIDKLSINEGLKYSEVKRYKGEFKFELDNNKEDYIHLGLELIRKGKKVGHLSKKLKEGSTFEIKSLLSKAQKEDYIIIDIIEGPEEAIKLYKVPLFRESDNWKMSQGNDLPSPPVDLFVDGVTVNGTNGISFSKIEAGNFNGELKYVLSDFVDFEVISSQAGDVKANLVRKGIAVRSITTKGVKRTDTIQLNALLEVAEKGDAIVVQFGDPEGLRFSGMFFIQ